MLCKIFHAKIWIHGGSFKSGSSSMEKYDPLALVAETNIICVSLNYRLGLYGFLYLNNTDASGNQGT